MIVKPCLDFDLAGSPPTIEGIGIGSVVEIALMLALSQRYPQKRAIITGAASGIGEALSMQLAAEHWQIAMCDVNGTALEEAAARIEAAGGIAYPYAFDVRDRPAYSRSVDNFVSKCGGIDLLVNNAGIGSGGATGEMTLEDWDLTLSINLTGVVNGIHFAMPHLKEQRSGHILSTASAAAFASMPNMAAYNASKAAVLAISETLHTELAPYGIRVSCLMPSFVRTDLHKRLIGTRESLIFAKRLITESKFSATDLASYTLGQVGQGELYIVFPPQAKRIWALKRWLPGRYFKTIRKYAPPVKPAQHK